MGHRQQIVATVSQTLTDKQWLIDKLNKIYCHSTAKCEIWGEKRVGWGSVEYCKQKYKINYEQQSILWRIFAKTLG
ncbi:hypothetical protein AGMMS4956_13290 [Bacteroidia bacterium]|nr:hypothetical protein AGMMS4956_13290 [Bacteroidia bacterium]